MSNYPSTRKPVLETTIEILVHVLTWAYIFLSPLLFKRSGEQIDWHRYWHGCILPFTLCVAFYVNYLIFVPRFLLVKGKEKWFVMANILLFLCYQMGVEFQGMLAPPVPHDGDDAEMKHFPPKIYFVVRGFLLYIFAVGGSVALNLSMRWRKSEQARAEAELGRSQAELKNLKNQINPHFLLNTLNNIYALTAFDQDKAQHAIQELSRLLRYMLYENQTDRVSLRKEVEFLQSYISLMKLRILNDVDVRTEFDFPDSENLQVAPLIFISLVENAFKHGIGTGGNNFIHIKLKADMNRLSFSCENSNTPKNSTDKAPGGIGLQQVAKRLEYAYPKQYKWETSVVDDGRTYRSVIEIENLNLSK